jgi:hypothetical protein
VGMGSKARKNRIKSKGQPRSVERTVPEAWTKGKNLEWLPDHQSLQGFWAFWDRNRTFKCSAAVWINTWQLWNGDLSSMTNFSIKYGWDESITMTGLFFRITLQMHPIKFSWLNL